MPGLFGIAYVVMWYYFSTSPHKSDMNRYHRFHVYSYSCLLGKKIYSYSSDSKRFNTKHLYPIRK